MQDDALRNWWEELLQIHEFAQYRSSAEELTRHEVDFLREALQLRGSETILDLACGSGRHSLELAQQGLTVVGMDWATPLLAYAREQAAERELAVTFVAGDMRALNELDRFDAIILMNNSFGLFDDQHNAAVLAACSRALAPGGRLALQVLNPYQIEAHLREFRNSWYSLGAGIVLRESAFEPRTATLEVGYRYLDPAQGLDVNHPGEQIRLYGFPELRALLEAVGLRPLSVFGEATLPPVAFDETCQWQVLIAVKDRPLTQS